MTAVAILLMPTLALLLYAMDRLEDRMTDEDAAEVPSGRPRHARPRHLRPVPDTFPRADEPAHGDRPDAADAADAA
ncbi:hypothetical protein ABZ946_21035 [Streptomyces sp. NPDC046324]|uniref:hypothetical protein n=1 Tax=Streptomyces sp. NPDC046324 TaxID=3154915 RepID=UPI0033E4B964